MRTLDFPWSTPTAWMAERPHVRILGDIVGVAVVAAGGAEPE